MSLALLSYHHAAHGLAIALLHLSRWEWVFAVCATFIALASTLPSLVERRRHLPGLLAAAGGALLIAATTVPWLRDAIWPHSVMSVCGGSLLVAAHLRNRSAMRDRLEQMRGQ